MKHMNSKVLKSLEHKQNDINITLYLPLKEGPQNTNSNTSGLHHAVTQIKKILQDAEIPKSKHEVLINQLKDLDQKISHPESGKSLAVFIDKYANVIPYLIPFSIEASIYVMAHSLQFGPLKAQYDDHLHYWVLNLSQHGCRLFKGDKQQISEVKDNELSKNIATALRLELSDEKMPQSHSVNSPGSAPSESFNGHGGYKDISKKYLEEYLRKIDKHVTRHIAKPSEPVILVGVEYVQAIYKKVSHRKNLLTSKSALDHNTPTIINIKRLVEPIMPHLSAI